MKVEITLTAPAAAGKTHLDGYFKDAVARFEKETGQKVDLRIQERRCPSEFTTPSIIFKRPY